MICYKLLCENCGQTGVFIPANSTELEEFEFCPKCSGPTITESYDMDTSVEEAWVNDDYDL